MALKFLNKKGWHTGSLRNIENVWKAEQKHDAEQKKLEELRKQIHEERERNEFRLLQQQAGLVPKQERLDFLYESGLAVGKSSSDGGGSGFKALESLPTETPSSSSSAPKQSASSSVLGALFEEKPQSANDAWRKLHSDPLLLIRQREQDALGRVKNNPVQMALIRKSVEEKQHKEKARDKKEHRKNHHHSSSRHEKHSSSKQKLDSKNDTAEGKTRTGNHWSSSYDEHYDRARAESEDESSKRESRTKEKSYKGLKYKEQSPSGLTDLKSAKSDGQDAIKTNHDKSKHQKHSSSKQKFDSKNVTKEGGTRTGNHWSSSYDKHYDRARAESEDESSKRESRSKEKRYKGLKYKEQSPSGLTDPKSAKSDGQDAIKGNHDKSKHDKYSLESQTNFDADRKERENGSFRKTSYHDSSTTALGRESHFKRRNVAPKLSEEERAARLREMQVDAELHEEQRWKRLRKAEDDDAREATRARVSGGRNFLDAAQKSVYGAERGGSSTIEESVRRRTHYLQGRSEAGEGNAFRR